MLYILYVCYHLLGEGDVDRGFAPKREEKGAGRVLCNFGGEAVEQNTKQNYIY